MIEICNLKEGFYPEYFSRQKSTAGCKTPLSAFLHNLVREEIVHVVTSQENGPRKDLISLFNTFKYHEIPRTK